MGTKVTNTTWSRYTRATTEEKQRLIGLSCGEPGSRKTTFWLEAPGPIVIFSLDQGLEGVVAKVLEKEPEKEIYVKEYLWQPNPDDDVSKLQDDAIAIRDEFAGDFEHAIQNARTIVVDKETQLWELYRYAEFGAPNDAPRNYPMLNQRYRRIINMVKAADCNFGLIEDMKDEWVSKTNKKTGAQGAVASGNRIRAGFGELDGLVHLVLTHTGVGPDDWAVDVGKARGPGGHEVAGQTFAFADVPSFVELAQLIYPSSSEGDWR